MCRSVRLPDPIPRLLRARERRVERCRAAREVEPPHEGARLARAVLAVHLGGGNGGLSALGATLYFWARLIYVPLYAFGVPFIRSVVWGVSLVGIALLLVALLG